MSRPQRNAKFWIFLTLVLLVVSYAAYDYQNEKQTEKTKSEKSLILPWKADQISGLEISSGETQIKLKKTVDGWLFEAPLQELADSEAVSQFVEGLVLEKSTEIAQDKPSVEWKVFGLDQPKGVIKIKDNLGKEALFTVASKKNFQGDAFLRRDQENRVLIASSTWLQKIDKKVYDFRDKRWAKISLADLTEIAIAKGSMKMRLVKREANWSSFEKPQWKLDQNKVRRFLGALSKNQIQNFDFKADSPALMKIELSLKDGKKWLGEFGVTKDKKHYLKCSDSISVREILAQDMDEIYKVNLDGFRDRAEPFQFHKEDVKKIEYTSGAKSLKLEGKDLDQGAVRAALSKIADLELKNFTEKAEDQDLSKNASHLVLKDAGDKVLLDFTWGGLGPKHPDFLGKTNLYSLLFTIEEDKIKGLGLEQITSEKDKK